MIKLASITPIKDFYLSLEGDGPIMLLTHLVHRFPEYAEQARNYKGYKILDNSLIEMGSALNLTTVLEAAEKVDADEIILPDVFRDSGATFKAIGQALGELSLYYKENPGTKKYKIMAVAQGEDEEAFKECFMLISLMPRVDVIGIPKAVKNRATMASLFLTTDKEIHFLGCPESLGELILMGPVLRNRIRSIDTCIPALNSSFTSHAWAARPKDRTIDLVNDRVNLDNYVAIMKEVEDTLDKLSPPYIYLAGPLFTEDEQRQRRREAKALRSHGFEVFSPLELNESGVTDAHEIFSRDLIAMTRADACVLTLDNYDSGTMVELGYFLGKEKPVVAIWSDFRSEVPANLFVRGAATYGANHTLRSFDIERIASLLLNPFQE